MHTFYICIQVWVKPKLVWSNLIKEKTKSTPVKKTGSLQTGPSVLCPHQTVKIFKCTTTLVSRIFPELSMIQHHLPGIVGKIASSSDQVWSNLCVSEACA